MNQISQNFPNPDSPEIEEVISALSKITSRSSEEIKLYLNELLKRLAPEHDSFDLASFSETATHEEWSAEFHQWIDSHRNQSIPVLSEEAMSRENMYPDRW